MVSIDNEFVDIGTTAKFPLDIFQSNNDGYMSNLKPFQVSMVKFVINTFYNGHFIIPDQNKKVNCRHLIINNPVASGKTYIASSIIQIWKSYGERISNKAVISNTNYGSNNIESTRKTNCFNYTCLFISDILVHHWSSVLSFFGLLKNFDFVIYAKEFKCSYCTAVYDNFLNYFNHLSDNHNQSVPLLIVPNSEIVNYSSCDLNSSLLIIDDPESIKSFNFYRKNIKSCFTIILSANKRLDHRKSVRSIRGLNVQTRPSNFDYVCDTYLKVRSDNIESFNLPDVIETRIETTPCFLYFVTTILKSLGIGKVFIKRLKQINIIHIVKILESLVSLTNERTDRIEMKQIGIEYWYDRLIDILTILTSKGTVCIRENLKEFKIKYFDPCYICRKLIRVQSKSYVHSVISCASGHCVHKSCALQWHKLKNTSDMNCECCLKVYEQSQLNPVCFCCKCPLDKIDIHGELIKSVCCGEWMHMKCINESIIFDDREGARCIKCKKNPFLMTISDYSTFTSTFLLIHRLFKKYKSDTRILVCTQKNIVKDEVCSSLYTVLGRIGIGVKLINSRSKKKKITNNMDEFRVGNIHVLLTDDTCYGLDLSFVRSIIFIDELNGISSDFLTQCNGRIRRPGVIHKQTIYKMGGKS